MPRNAALQFSTDLVLENAKISKAIRPGPTNQRHLKLLGEPIEKQIYVHGSFGRGYCRIMENSKAVVVAFRGTRDKIDWAIANVRALPVPLTDCGNENKVRVHKGFQSALDFIDKSTKKRSLEAIFSKLDSAEIGDRELYITGHSLGGAIATIFATKLRHNRPAFVEKNLKGIITFGAPSAGLKSFFDYYGNLHLISLRLVHDADAVPYAPPIGYRHVGSALWLRNGRIVEDPGWRARLRATLALMSPTSFVTNHFMSEYVESMTALKEASSQ